MKRLLLALVSAAGLATADPRSARIEAMARELAEITGLALKRPIRHATIDREGVRRFLEERIRDEVKPRELRAEELVLKKFGFVPPDYDLRKSTIDLMTEQAAAFYDYRRRRLFTLDSAGDPLEEPTLFHEVAHALADQHFSLGRFVDGARDDDEASLARMAVMEGQATWLMFERQARRAGGSLKDSPEMIEMLKGAGAGPAGQFPVFDAAPLYMRESLMFPYSEGMSFQHAVFVKLGRRAFAEVFLRPPSTTQQILHPERYMSPVGQKVTARPPQVARGSYRVLVEGSIGEFDHSILLRQYAGRETARLLAPAWTAGAYRLLEPKRGAGGEVLAYASCWESEERAREFFVAWGAVQKGKWKSHRVARETSGLREGAGDDGRFQVRLEDRCVSSLEGLPAVH
jgi:hypothetical protein